MIARDGELPAFFDRSEWRGATGGLLLTTLFVITFILFFDLAGIAMMGSGAFLLIYAAVHAGHLRIVKQTGAQPQLLWVALLLCLIMFVVLEIYTFNQSPVAVYTMIGLLLISFLLEKGYEAYRS